MCRKEPSRNAATFASNFLQARPDEMAPSSAAHGQPVALVSMGASSTTTALALRSYFRIKVCKGLPAEFVFPIPGRGSLAAFFAKGPMSLDRALGAQAKFGGTIVCIFTDTMESRLWFHRAVERCVTFTSIFSLWVPFADTSVLHSPCLMAQGERL